MHMIARPYLKNANQAIAQAAQSAIQKTSLYSSQTKKHYNQRDLTQPMGMSSCSNTTSQPNFGAYI